MGFGLEFECHSTRNITFAVRATERKERRLQKSCVRRRDGEGTRDQQANTKVYFSFADFKILFSFQQKGRRKEKRACMRCVCKYTHCSAWLGRTFNFSLGMTWRSN